MTKKNVMLGILGPMLDSGAGPKRWERWRPTVAMCQHEELLLSRYELLYEKKFATLAKQIVEDIALVSPETKVRLHEVNIEDPWDFELVYGALHDFARSYDFDPDSEEYLVNITTGTHVAQICMFLLTESRHLPGYLAQSSPPHGNRSDNLAGTYRIIDLDLSKYDRLNARFELEHCEGTSLLKLGIDTRSDDFNRLIDTIERVASVTRDPILLTGPTGAGKSQLARQIYQLKRQRRQMSGQLVEVNCATLRGDSAMSALFGHVRGAFTGADTDRAGLLRTADGGLLFLDEIGELPLDEQAMLLQAIEEKTFLPVGADATSTSDFELIAGTNRDLHAEVERGRFREDLLARINLWTFRLPGLAERREDIEPNLDYELARHATRTGRKVTISREARQRFLQFAISEEAVWKANFRDLGAAVTRMATLAAGGRIDVERVEAEKARLSENWSDALHGPAPEAEAILEKYLDPEVLAQLDRFDRFTLGPVLQTCLESLSLSAAGRKLFDVSRTKRKTANDADRLRKYLARFQLTWDDLQSE